MSSLAQTRLDLAKRSHWNIGYFLAGLLFWLFVALTGQMLPIETARYHWLVGTFCIFPVAVLASLLFRADPFTRGNKLAELVGYTHMNVIALSFPLVLSALIFYPTEMLLAMAILYCLDFFVMTWAFGTPIFAFHALVRTVLVTLVWFAWPDFRLPAIPLIVAACYLVTILLIYPLRKRWIQRQPHPCPRFAEHQL